MALSFFSGKVFKYLFILSVTLNLLCVCAWGVHLYRSSHVMGPDGKTYYLNTQTMYALLPVNNKDIVLVGDSHTKRFSFTEYFAAIHSVKNRGIEGDISGGVLNRMNEVIPGKPEKIFIEIGYNDLTYEITPDSICKNIKLIVDKIKAGSPATKIYINSIFPSDKADLGVTVKDEIVATNKLIKQLCIDSNIPYIDIYSKLSYNGVLNQKYSGGDGIHLNGPGYILWAETLRPYIQQ